MNKKKEIEELKLKNKKLEDLNNQYFRNIIKLQKDYLILDRVCIFELAIIMLLIYLMVIVL